MISPPASLNREVESEQKWKGAVLIVLAFLLVAVMSALGKGASRLSPLTVAFFQSFVSLVILSPWFFKNFTLEVKTEHLSLHFIRATTGLLSQVLMFLAIRKMPLMNAVLLSNSAPLFIPLVALFWLKEKMNRLTWVSLLVGFIGIILILNPNRSLFENPSSSLAVLAAVFSAIALVSVKRLSMNDSTEKILFYYFLISSLVMGCFLPFNWISLEKSEWFYLIGIGLCMAASQVLIVTAYRYAKPSAIAPFNYSVVIFSGLIGWLVWDNIPEPLAYLGVLLVCLGGMFSALFSPHSERNSHVLSANPS